MFLQISFTQNYLKIQEISKTVHFQKLYELWMTSVKVTLMFLLLAMNIFSKLVLHG